MMHLREATPGTKIAMKNINVANWIQFECKSQTNFLFPIVQLLSRKDFITDRNDDVVYELVGEQKASQRHGMEFLNGDNSSFAEEEVDQGVSETA